MKTLVNSKWRFDGIEAGSLCFSSKLHVDMKILCGVACKFVDVTTGNVAILTYVSGSVHVDAEWTYATLRKAQADSIRLPEASSILEEV